MGKEGKKIIADAAPSPMGAYPHARKEGDFLFLSGIGPRKPGSSQIPGVTMDTEGNVVDYNIEIQTRSVIENIKIVLEACGSSLDKVIDIMVFLTDMKRDFQTYNRIYAEYFTEIAATRTTVEVGALPSPIAVEFKVIARA